MANYANLISSVQAVIAANGNNEITGPILQQTLIAIINSLGVGYQYMEVATPSTNPGTPDQNVFYLASTAGTYSNFNSIVLGNGEVAILRYNGAWTKESSGFGSQEAIDNIIKIINGNIALTFTNGVQIDYRDGATYSSASARCTGYLDVSGIQKILYTRAAVQSTTTNAGMAFYDANKAYISGERFILGASDSHYEETTLVVPSNAVYARFTFITTQHIADEPFVKDVNSINTEIQSLQQDTAQLQLDVLVDANFMFLSGGVDYEDGTDTTTSTVRRTNFINIDGITRIIYNRGIATSSTTKAGMAFYDENKTYISGQRWIVGAPQHGYVDTELNVPQNAKFARFTFWKETENPEQPYIKCGANILRTQINGLALELENIRKEIDGKIIFQLSGPAGIDYSTGDFMTSGYITVRCTADYIDLTGITKIRYSRGVAPSSTTKAGMAFYDSSKTYISGQRFILSAPEVGYETTELDVPANAKYARFTFWLEQYDADEPFVKDLGAEIPYIEKEIDDINQRINVTDALRGKKISVIGDSISCFGTESQTRNNGYNAPYWIVKQVDVGQTIQSWVTWLDVYTSITSTTPTNKTIGGVLLTAAMIGTKQTFVPVAADVGKAIGVPRWALSYTSKPWWQVLIDKTGAVLCNNASWSGSRMVPIPVGNDRHDAFVLSEAYSDYTVGRVANRDDAGQQIVPDVILIQRGINDFSALDPEGGAGADVAEDITTPNMLTFDTIVDDYNFTQAYIYTIKKLRQTYPKAYIVVCTLNIAKQRNVSKFPPNNGTYTLPDYNNKIREIANLMGCGLIEFDKDGITFENCYPTYMSDSETNPTHPNTLGHLVMGEKATHDLTYILNE